MENNNLVINGLERCGFHVNFMDTSTSRGLIVKAPLAYSVVGNGNPSIHEFDINLGLVFKPSLPSQSSRALYKHLSHGATNLVIVNLLGGFTIFKLNTTCDNFILFLNKIKNT